MQTLTTIGLDIAKSVFQVDGIDAEGKVPIRRQLKRRHVLAFFEKLRPCLVGIEACAIIGRANSVRSGIRPPGAMNPPVTARPVQVFERQDQSGDNALLIEFGPGRVEFGGVTQLVFLPPGDPRQSTRLTVADIMRNGSLGRKRAGSRFRSHRQEFAVSFSVAEDCPLQTIKLVLDARSASEAFVSGSIWGTGEQIRNWTYVSDIIQGTLRVRWLPPPLPSFFLNRFFYPDHSATSEILSELAFALSERQQSIRPEKFEKAKTGSARLIRSASIQGNRSPSHRSQIARPEAFKIRA